MAEDVYKAPNGETYTGTSATQMRRYFANSHSYGEPAPLPAGSPLAEIATGAPIDALQTTRDTLRAALVEVDDALDRAEVREARAERRRRGGRTAELLGQVKR